MNIAESLRQWREQQGISVHQLSKVTDIKHQNLYRWEHGNSEPSISMCVRLADYYGITVDELIGRTD